MPSAPDPASKSSESASKAAPASDVRDPRKLTGGDWLVLLGILGVWGAAASLTHFLFSVGWAWSIALGPVLLLVGFAYLLGTTEGSVRGGKTLASIFQRPRTPRR